MGGTVRLAEARLRYGGDSRLHTASSGPIEALHELYLIVERDGEIACNGAVRVNIAYLNGVPEAAAVEDASASVAAIDWSADFSALLSIWAPQRETPSPRPAILWIARSTTASPGRRGQPLSVWLGAARRAAVITNQTLFWSDAETMLRRARDYVARGFRSLKLRCAVATFADDLERLRALRDEFGGAIEIAIDVNGRWSADEAAANARELEWAELAYIEEPVPPGDWAGLKRLSQRTAIPIMLDESLSNLAAVEMAARLKPARAAHLKLVKMGGIAPALAAAALLRDAGMDIMVGQMNEGGLATAAAAHCAIAANAMRAELYGADGIFTTPPRACVTRRAAWFSPARPGSA